MGSRVSAAITVAAPAVDTFAAATDWVGQKQWMFATDTRAARGSGHQVGDELSARTGFGLLGFTDTMIITDWSPPYRCSVRHTGRVVRGTADFEVAARDDHTSVFTWSEDLEAPLGRVGALALDLGRPVSAWFLRLCLRRFAAWAPTR